MEIVIVTYEPELDFNEVESLLRKSTETYRGMDGLVQKFYLHDEESGRVGGVYVFDSEESADRLLESDIQSNLKEAYKTSTVDIERYDVLFPLHESADSPASP